MTREHLHPYAFHLSLPRRSLSAGGWSLYNRPPSPRLRRVEVVLSLWHFPVLDLTVKQVDVIHSHFPPDESGFGSSDFPHPACLPEAGLSREAIIRKKRRSKYSIFYCFCQAKSRFNRRLTSPQFYGKLRVILHLGGACHFL